MDIIRENFSVSMIREHLERIPDYVLPRGYHYKWYQPGDEKLWVDIQLKSEKHAKISFDIFWREFDNNTEALKQRQCYLCDANGQAIGTTTAWFNDNYNGQPYGRIHWVAMIPEMQGKGLAKPLLSTACRRMRQLGHKRAYLVTSTARIPAINLYRKFGFVLEIRDEQDKRVWGAVLELLANRGSGSAL